jgi:hypothetical protein
MKVLGYGGIANNSYLSSSEYNSTDAWYQGFGGGSQGNFSKNYTGVLCACYSVFLTITLLAVILVKGRRRELKF